ncbi:outer dense fiber protein 4 [Erinaceus europaeus]|uniref:Outer dense fiber protein 4 n=1 Tax=Erinaceus europaeus TaxID=9365 RepID=A0A1S2ZRS5_ERIEU|nr:outer dense fiber protein 4 [Erinaceus europaeus]
MSIKDLQRRERAGMQDGVEEKLGEVSHHLGNSAIHHGNNVIHHRRISVLPLRWKLVHSSRWRGQLLASELSLVAFILLLVMVLSKKWLYLSRCRFYQRWPTNVTTSIYTSIHIMSMGLIHICRSKSCFNSENANDTFKMWTNHPIFGLSKITFHLALGLGFVLTIWLHLPYLPGCQKMPSFVWIGTVLSFCEVAFIFFTLILFPINLWVFELKRNLSIPIGWSYFIGWLVFILYISCGSVCYLNYKHFWRLLMSRPTDTSRSNLEDIFCCKEPASNNTAQNEEVQIEEVLEKKRESLDSEEMKASLDPEEMKESQDPVKMKASLDPEEMKESRDPVEMKASRDPVEMKASRDPVEMKASQDPVEMKASQDPVEMKTSQDPAESMPSLN